MADQKLADLTALTAPSGDDLLYVVDDPAGTPLDRKIALNNLFTRGTVTVSSPVIDAAQTWNDGGVTFTGLKFNATDTASAAGSLLMDLQVGGASRFTVSKAGVVKFFGNLQNSSGNAAVSFSSGGYYSSRESGGSMSFRGASTTQFSWSDGFDGLVNIDTILSRRAAANLRFGAADAAAPVAQTLSVQSVVAGTTNTAGANLTITGSQGTGTGAGGSIIFQVAPAGSSGSAQNALATALQVNGNGGITGQDGTTADTLALRNGANAQEFRVYGTTDGTNSEFLAIKSNAGGTFDIGPRRTGTGVAQNGSLNATATSGSSVIACLTWGSFGGGFLQTSVGFSSAAAGTYDLGATNGGIGGAFRRLILAQYIETSEMTAPAAPAANGVRIYAVDNGSGKTQLMALFATGAAQQIAIEP